MFYTICLNPDIQYSSERFVVLLVKESTPAKVVVPWYEITKSTEFCVCTD